MNIVTYKVLVTFTSMVVSSLVVLQPFSPNFMKDFAF